MTGSSLSVARTPPRRRAGLFPAALGLAVLILGLSFTAAVSVGAVPVAAKTVWGVIADRLLPGLVETAWPAGHEAIIWELRVPRTILAGLVGAGLALVGAGLQAVTRNALADPHLLGISSGGAFGAITALLHTGLILGLATVPLFAFAGALCAMALVLGVARLADAASAERLVLAGVAVSFVVMAGANVMIFLGDPRASHMVIFWMLGSLGLAQWSQLVFPAFALAVCGAWLWSRAQDLDAMTIGDESAATLGIPVARFRLEVFVAGALLTGTMVAFSGVIGFVGLMVPHVARMMVGGGHARVLPLSALLGAVFLIWCDLLSRTVMAPQDMPIGVVTGLVGGLFFVWLLGRRQGGAPRRA
jgi:iron complex transport system permease protein